MSADTGAKSTTTRKQMHYMHSYTHVFKRDDWLINLIMGSLCLFIPVIGHLVFMGYQYQVIEGFIRRPNAKLAKFDFSEFTQMLNRGIYPFVVSMALQFLMVPIFLIIAFVPMAIPLMFEFEMQRIAIMFVALFIVFATIAFILVIHLIIGPLMLRAGLSQSFGETFDMKWIRSFIKMMWLEEIMSLFFLMFSSLVVVGIGIILCFVGMYPAATLVMLAMSHLSYQQYAIFLANGGEPIPLKEEAPCYPVEQPQ